MNNLLVFAQVSSLSGLTGKAWEILQLPQADVLCALAHFTTALLHRVFPITRAHLIFV